MRVQPVKLTKVFSLKRSDEGDSSGCKKRSDCIKEDPCGYVMYGISKNLPGECMFSKFLHFKSYWYHVDENTK